MTRIRQLFAVARACFRPASPQTLMGVSAYLAYLVWLAMRGIDSVGDTAFIHLSVALAVAGAWVGRCVARAAQWPGASFAPPFTTALGIVAAFVIVSAVGINSAAAIVGELDLLTFAVFAPLAAAAGLSAGYARPYMATCLSLILLILVPLGPLFGADVALTMHGTATSLLAAAALVSGVALLAKFTFRLHAHKLTSPSPAWPLRSAIPKLPRNRLWEPSIPHVVVWSGLLAATCTFAHRHPGLEWRDSSLVVLIASLCAVLGAPGKSVSFSCGPIPAVGWLVLSGGAKSRSAAARRMLWVLVAISFLAAGVFTAVTIALGPDWHLVEMIFVCWGASHAYLAAACPSRWLLSSRLSVLVATPAVVAIAWAAWTHIPWAVPTALAACVVSGVAAVYLGGIGMGRIDLDPILNTEPTP